MTNLKLFKEKLKIFDHENWMNDPSQFDTEETGQEIDENIFMDNFHIVQNSQISSKSETDAVLVRAAYETFKHLPESILTDIRMWQWVSLKVFYNYSEWRWDLTEERMRDKPSLLKHLYSGMGIDGLSRNSISRLVIPCLDLVENDDYSLVEILFQNQQSEQSIMQSKQSMNRNTFRAMVKSVEGLNDKELRERIKRVNALSTVYNFPSMPEEKVYQVIHQA